MVVEMDQEIKIEPVESDCLFELKKENFIKVENVFEPKSESNESAFLEDPLKVSSDTQGQFSCKNKINSKISNVNENCSKIDRDRPINTEEEDKIPKTNTELTSKQLKEIVRKGQEFTDFIKELDPNVERQSKIVKIIDDCLRCYKEEAKEKFKNDAKQTKVNNFFTKPSSKPSSSTNRKIALEKVTDELLKLVKKQCGNHSATSMAKMLKVNKTTLHSRIKDQKITFSRHQGPCHFCELITKSTEPNTTNPISTAPPSKLQRKSRCKICKQLFLSKSEMKSHNIEVHDGKKPHCSICSSTFKTEWLLGRHDVVVHGKKKKKVKCKICDTVFKERKDYNEHILSVHDGKKPFPCTKCTSSFLEKNQLKIHILTVHDGIKPHKCNVCNERFGTSVQLNNHFKRVHEGEKNSLCTICGASFFEKRKLRIHTETVHEKKKPYKCSTCDGDFSHSQALRNHIIAVHEKKKPHLCSLCGMSFADKSNLTNHIRGVHRGIKRKKKTENLEETK